MNKVKGAAKMLATVLQCLQKLLIDGLSAAACSGKEMSVFLMIIDYEVTGRSVSIPERYSEIKLSRSKLWQCFHKEVEDDLESKVSHCSLATEA